MKGYISSITEEETSFLLEVSIDKPDLWDLDSCRKEARMSREEHRAYRESDEFKKISASVEEEQDAIRTALKLGEVELTL